MPDKINNCKIVKYIRAFLESKTYPVFLGVVIFVGYILAWPLISLTVLGLLCACVFLFLEDTRPALAIVVMMFLSLRYQYDITRYASLTAILVYSIGGAIVLGSVIFHFMVYKPQRYKRELPVGMFLLCLAFFLGGMFGDYFDWRNIRNAAAFTGSLCAVYYVFSYTIPAKEDNLLYFARVCAVMICIIALQVLDFYILNYKMGQPLDGTWKFSLVLGWGISNSAGEMMAMLLPAVFYLIYKEDHGYSYYIIIITAAIAIYFTLSRNALLFGGGVIFVGMFLNAFVGKNRKVNAVIMMLIYLVAALAVMSLFEADKGGKLIAFFKESLLSDHSRFDIWKEYIRLFKEEPFLGVGFAAYRILNPGEILNAHNTLIQILSVSGIIGFVFYFFHRTQTVAMILRKPNSGKLFMGACIIIGLLQSLLDPLFFRVYFLLLYSALLMLIEKETLCLPLKGALEKK